MAIEVPLVFWQIVEVLIEIHKYSQCVGVKTDAVWRFFLYPVSQNIIKK